MSSPQLPEMYIDVLQKAGGDYRIRLSIPELAYFPVPGTSGADLSGLEWIAGLTTGPADGKKILDWLLADGKLKSAWEKAFQITPQRCIRLILDPDAVELCNVPWELLYEDGPGKLGWVAGSNAAPFSRLLAGEWDPAGPVLERPLRVLVAIANPTNLPQGFKPVKADEFWNKLQEATAELAAEHLIELVPLEEPCTLPRLEEKLQEGFHVLHFIGHGDFKPNLGGAIIYLAGPDNRSKFETARDVADMLGRQVQHVQRLGKPLLRMVTLASCNTATSSFLSTSSSFAETLGQKGLPVVLAMQDLVEDRTAMRFVARFYRHLLTQGRVDVACNQARAELLTGKASDAHVPVLFSRLKGNQLVEITGAAVPRGRAENEPEVVFIPAGEFFMGANPQDAQAWEWEKPGGPVYLPAYCIGKYPVTNQEYWAFIQAVPRQEAPRFNWLGQRPDPQKMDHPVVDISWHAAQAYCQWLRGLTGRYYRLPSEAEWEKAARGSQGACIYPWGDDWQDHRCQQGGQVTAPVNAYPAQSVTGCFDLVGNAKEWTGTLVGRSPNPQQAEFRYPWKPDRRNLEETAPGGGSLYFIQRGGSVFDAREKLRCSARDLDDSREASRRCGFRVVMDLSHL